MFLLNRDIWTICSEDNLFAVVCADRNRQFWQEASDLGGTARLKTPAKCYLQLSVQMQ